MRTVNKVLSTAQPMNVSTTYNFKVQSVSTTSNTAFIGDTATAGAQLSMNMEYIT